MINFDTLLADVESASAFTGVLIHCIVCAFNLLFAVLFLLPLF